MAFSNVKQLVKRAKEMGMPAVAITDHGTMFGSIDFFNAANAGGNQTDHRVGELPGSPSYD
jgi:DNA polymerase III alpha subunit